MSKVKILDCTLRDGGYVNEWNFGKQTIKGITENLANAGVDIIEMGFLTDKSHSEDDSLFTTTSEMKKVTAHKGNSMVAGMIALGEKETDAEKLDPASKTGVDIIRITFHNDIAEIAKAISFAHTLMGKGYRVCMQPVGTTTYTDEELVYLIKKMNELKPYAFYLVDTLGTLYKDKLMHFVKLIDSNLDKGIKLGFHSHNNLQMSYSNAQLIVEHDSDREFILDSSLYGMGRGAGNLNTELIARFINEYEGKNRYNLVPVLDSIDNHIYPLSLRYSWGYNAHYYMSAIHNCHPNYAAYLMNMQTLTMNEVNLILQNLPQESRAVFNKALIEKLYINYQKSSDTKVQKDSIGSMKGKEVLVLAPGQSVKTHKKQILDYVKKHKPLVFAVNVDAGDIPTDYVFISNKKRLLSFDYDKSKAKIIITSNLPKLSDKFTCVDYESLCDERFEQPDNAGMMLLRLLASKGCKEAKLAGFDGFRVDADNYVTKSTIASRYSIKNTQEKNKNACKQIVDISKTMPIEFLTPSIYKDMIDGKETPSNI